ncbi:hypothetical protein BSR29_00480 [Boudabousia liubingyangii]|uniref:Uncharacterized protein n=1 Tax=Boudabousia liubingyangii TaxID=1921764 RepID=A0A1Q5PQG4_9ACTO|nr:DUF6270 domain-containing protein [Boudabousia liubingyangii]OKL49861.1 hypothetical protein BSR29_00480 [Boudabousia liubingyangii]
MAVPAKRLFIYGSCVSRDMAEFASSAGLVADTYVARQSLVSAGSQVDVSKLGDFATGGAFGSRMVRADAQGDLYERLLATGHRADRILWDLIDERLGVYAFPDGTYATRSYELLLSEGVDFVPAGARLIPFGSAEHFDLWAKALDRFLTFLGEHDWLAKTRLLYVPWAPFDSNGEDTPASFGIDAMSGNMEYVRYYEEVRSRNLVQLIEPPEDLVIADPDHKWGPAPFHYHQELYDWVAWQL